MRVLIASHIEVVAGGAELALVELLLGLLQQHPDIEPQVVVPMAGPLEHRLTELGVTTHVRAQPWWAFSPRGTVGERATTAFNVARAVPPMHALVRAARPDVVVTNSLVAPEAALAAAAARVPHVWQVQEFGDRDHGLRFLVGRGSTHRLVHRLSTKVIVPSAVVAADLGPERVHEVPYAVAGAWDDLPPVVEPFAPRAATLLLAGHKKSSKGQADAVEALGQLARLGVRPELLLVGRGDSDAYERRLAERAVELGVRDQVRLLPPTVDLTDLYGRAGIALMCSRNEALGRVTVEAMKAGVPVVGLDAGATRELLADGRGLLYAAGDIAALALHVRTLLGDPVEAGRLAARAQAWSRERFSLAAYADATAGVWRAAVGALPGAG